MNNHLARFAELMDENSHDAAKEIRRVALNCSLRKYQLLEAVPIPFQYTGKYHEFIAEWRGKTHYENLRDHVYGRMVTLQTVRSAGSELEYFTRFHTILTTNDMSIASQCCRLMKKMEFSRVRLITREFERRLINQAFETLAKPAPSQYLVLRLGGQLGISGEPSP